MVRKVKQVMSRDFVRDVNFLVKALSNRYSTRKIGKFNTGGGKADSDTYDNKEKGVPVNISGMYVNKFIPYSKCSKYSEALKRRSLLSVTKWEWGMTRTIGERREQWTPQSRPLKSRNLRYRVFQQG